MTQRIIDVRIGEVKVAKNGETLRTILGSCVGIGIIWPERKICGLAHCLLSKSPEPTFAIGGRFVDQAVSSLLVLMKIKPENFDEIKVIITGGGNMIQPGLEDREHLVGNQNFLTSKEEFERRQIKIHHLEQAHEEGRRLTIDSTAMTFVIQAIPRIAEM